MLSNKYLNILRGFESARKDNIYITNDLLDLVLLAFISVTWEK